MINIKGIVHQVHSSKLTLELVNAIQKEVNIKAPVEARIELSKAIGDPDRAFSELEAAYVATALLDKCYTKTMKKKAKCELSDKEISILKDSPVVILLNSQVTNNGKFKFKYLFIGQEGYFFTNIGLNPKVLDKNNDNK